MNDKKAKILSILICVLSILFITISAVKYNIEKDKDENKNEENIKEENKIEEKYEELDIKLVSQKEDHLFDEKVSMTFDGEEVSEEMYQYYLTIKINEKELDTKFNKEKLVFSNNMASSFKIIRFNGYYLIISSIAKQNDGMWVLITDLDGNIKYLFEDVTFNFNKDSKKITIEDCITNEIDEECSMKEYELN